MELDPERYDKPKSAELTILLADIRGCTCISESLSPEALRDYIDEYLTAMSAVIRERHGGTLDKYIADPIMAFWGAPIDDADQARQCGARGAQFAACQARLAASCRHAHHAEIHARACAVPTRPWATP